MPELDKIFLYRITHLQNIKHILQYGITRSSSANRNPEFVSIGDPSLINSRNSFLLLNGKRLGNYLPFYFGRRMPMLYVIQNGFNGVKATAPENIVYCLTTVSAIKQSGLEYVFTNGHAVDSLTKFYDYRDIQDIDTIIDKKAIKSKYWKDENDLDLKRRKEAEFLILGDIPTEAVLGFAVYDKAAEQEILKMKGFSNKVLVVKPDYYF